MHTEFSKRLDEIKKYVATVEPEARATFAEILIKQLIDEFSPSRGSTW